MKTKPASQRKAGQRQRSPQPALWVRLLVAVLSPFVFLLSCEILLWAVDCGRPSGFFTPCEFSGRTVHMVNRDYCEHLVPRALSRAPESSYPGAKAQSAFAAVRAIAEALPGAQLNVPQLADAELLALCRRRLLDDDREAWRLAMVMYRRKALPPLAGQLDHDRELGLLRRVLPSVYGHIRGASEPDQARQWFRRAVDADPQGFLAHVGLGIQSNRLGQLREGMERVERAVALKPDFAQSYDILAAVHAQLGDTDEARRYGRLRDLFQPGRNGEALGADAL